MKNYDLKGLYDLANVCEFEDFVRDMKDRDQQIALEAQRYQTHIYHIRTLNNGSDIWGIRIARQGKQIYGDIAGSEQKAQEQLKDILAALKQTQKGAKDE